MVKTAMHLKSCFHLCMSLVSRWYQFIFLGNDELSSVMLTELSVLHINFCNGYGTCACLLPGCMEFACFCNRNFQWSSDHVVKQSTALTQTLPLSFSL